MIDRGGEEEGYILTCGWCGGVSTERLLIPTDEERERDREEKIRAIGFQTWYFCSHCVHRVRSAIRHEYELQELEEEEEGK
jgi:hypothetical protein